MERSRWRRPSPALVIACLALFVALGGTVLAATKIDGRTIKVKSLPGNRVAVGSLPGNRLKPGTIPGDRLAPNSVKGAQIDVGTLGQVPSADRADSATSARHADTATAADTAANAATINGRTVGCGEGKREFGGACWDVKVSPNAVTAIEGAAACAAAGGELPEALALAAFAGVPGAEVGVADEWTSDITEASISYGPIAVFFSASERRLATATYTTPKHFRCVTPLLH